MKVGIVLSSGGGRGIYGHTGFMLAVKKLNIEIEAMSGCSAGAVVGSIVASGGSIDEWSDALKHVSMKNFWTPRSTSNLLYSLFVKKGKGLLGLSSLENAIDFVSRYQMENTFEKCLYPFYAVAMNLGNDQKVVFQSKELAPRVIASAAIPFFYDPLEIDGEYYSDGAIVDLAPIDAICCKHKLDLVVIHHLANRSFTVEQLRTSFGKPWSIAEIVYRLVYRNKPWYETGEEISKRKCPCGCSAVIVVIEPKLPELKWPLTEGGVDIMESAEKQSLASLRSIFKDDPVTSTA